LTKGHFISVTELDEESGKLEISVDAADLRSVCGWMVIIRKAFIESGRSQFSLNAKGVIDNDYSSYTAFEILCNEKEIKIRVFDFYVELSEAEDDSDDRLIAYETKEYEAFEELAKATFRRLNDDEAYYDDDEYDAALEVIEGNDSFNDFEGDDEDDFNDEE
jgi:hypothetical protein